MVNKVHIKSVLGEVVGYTSRWNPLSPYAHVIVKVGHDTLRIPVDHRQVKYIRNEYPIGEMVELKFNGQWQITSHAAPAEFDISKFLYGVY